jgi:antitoxin component of MazEF toxin-antitoxin module
MNVPLSSNEQWTVYIPVALASAMGLIKGEEFQWVIINSNNLLLTRVNGKQSTDDAKAVIAATEVQTGTLQITPSPAFKDSLVNHASILTKHLINSPS